MAQTNGEPEAALDPRFSSEGASPTPWAKGSREIQEASIYWLVTVRPDGRPHVTPIMAVWAEGALYFCTGPDERKARNLRSNAHCAIVTGCNTFEGLDVVVEGEAIQVSDEATLTKVAGLLTSKYDWNFEVRDGAFYSQGGLAIVYQVAPATAFGFGRGDAFSQTRWRF